jgi:hypothetical protein
VFQVIPALIEFLNDPTSPITTLFPDIATSLITIAPDELSICSIGSSEKLLALTYSPPITYPNTYPRKSIFLEFFL